MTDHIEVCVMGLGIVGCPTAILVSKFFPTIGYDINEQAILKALEKGVNGSAILKYADVYIIAVSTYYKDHAPDMSAVDSCCQKISALNPNALVCFESTLFVGTARKMVSRYGLKYVVVCPHRYWGEDPENHGVRQLRVIGALNKESMEKAKKFYDTLEIPLHYLSSLELAEATKIAENAFWYVQIAFAEELKLIAEKNGLNFDELRLSINTKWNVKLAEARTGIGKRCLPKDTAFLALLDPEATLVRGAMKANENYVKSLKSSSIESGVR
jgi:nucleotide sugar dehydrogenase